jgi:glycopeptide antibiotics resistance protein
MNTPKEKKGYRIYLQYVLIGGAIGLYYGLFYRGPQSPPDYFMAILLSFVAAAVTLIVRFWKKKPSLTEILVDFLKIFGLFAAFLLGLELRKVIYEMWGKTTVTIFTTSLGVLIGLIVALRAKPEEKEKVNQK